MVTVKMTGDLVLKELTIDADAIDPEDPEMLQDMVQAAVNEALRAAQELRRQQDGRPDRRAWTSAASGLPGLLAARVYPPPVQRLITELGKLPGHRPAHRAAARVPHPARRRRGRQRARRRDQRGQGADRPLRGVLQPRRRARCAGSAPTSAATRALICVVEEPGDVIPIERTHEYRGRYHVLGGALSPIDGVDPEDLKIAELYRARRRRGPPVREVVLATNPTTTGEATALHIAAALRERAPDVTVTRLASGLPVGSDLEYADEVTLGKALAGRRAL